MTWADTVAEHHDHWLRFDGPDAVKCHTCSKDPGRRLLLPLRPELAATAAPAALHATDACPDHPGQRAGACGPCRAEQLERTPGGDPFRPVADVAAGGAAVRAALVEAAARRTQESS